MTEIEPILTAFEAMIDGTGNLDDPLIARMNKTMEAAGATGMTFPALAEAMLGRRLTAAEDNLATLRLEDMEGHA